MKASDIDPAYLKKHGIVSPIRASKYRNVKTEVDGVTYDSALEANCAAQLDRLLKLGLVTAWERQVRFDLGSGISYLCDFVVTYPTGQRRAIDAKGVQTAEFRLKRKLFEPLYGPLELVKDYRDIPTEGRP